MLDNRIIPDDLVANFSAANDWCDILNGINDELGKCIVSHSSSREAFMVSVGDRKLYLHQGAPLNEDGSPSDVDGEMIISKACELSITG